MDSCPEPGLADNGDDCDDGDPAINPGAEEQCGDGSDDDCDGSADEGCDPGDPGDPCGEGGPSAFSDDFNRPDGPIGGAYLDVSTMGLPMAFIENNQACGYDHNVALVNMDDATGSMSVSFDFWGANAGMEVMAVAADLCTGDIVVAGFNSGEFLTVLDFGLGLEYRHPSSFVLVPGHLYHIDATFGTDGIVSVVLSDGSTVMGIQTADLGRAPSLRIAGAVVGRNVQVGINCIDDLVITSN